MTDTANLCERLRDRAAFCKDCGGVTTYDEGDSALDNEAADLIERLDAMLAASPQGEGSPAEADQDALIERTCRECRALHRIFTEVVTPPASPQGEGGWTKHDGGPNPVPGKVVECRLAALGIPDLPPIQSEYINWDHQIGSARVIAYRVTEGVKP